MILFIVEEGFGARRERIESIGDQQPAAHRLAHRHPTNQYATNPGICRAHPRPQRPARGRIRLTPQGEAIINQTRAQFLATFRGLVSYLGEEDSAQLAGLLTRATSYFAGLGDSLLAQSE